MSDCIGRGELSGYGVGRGARTDGAPGDEMVVTIRVRCKPGHAWLDHGHAA